MTSFISANIGTIVISLILLLAICFAIRSVIRDKKKGTCSCGGSCGNCGMEGCCSKHSS